MILVLNNEDLNQVTWEQRVMEGDPALRCLAGHPLHALLPIRSDDRTGRDPPATATEIEDAVQQAFAADRPVVIDAMTDPEEPPLPPHITFDQAVGFGRSFLEAPKAGAPGVVEALREKVEELRPGGGGR